MSLPGKLHAVLFALVPFAALLPGIGNADTSDCQWKASFLSEAAVPLHPDRFIGIDRSTSFHAIIDQLGPAARDVGSGLYMLQWDVTDGRIFSISVSSPCSKPFSAGFRARK